MAMAELEPGGGHGGCLTRQRQGEGSKEGEEQRKDVAKLLERGIGWGRTMTTNFADETEAAGGGAEREKRESAPAVGVLTVRVSQERARAPSRASHAGGHTSKCERWCGDGQTVHGGEGGKGAAAIGVLFMTDSPSSSLFFLIPNSNSKYCLTITCST
jgi:hypothetical protein